MPEEYIERYLEKLKQANQERIEETKNQEMKQRKVRARRKREEPVIVKETPKPEPKSEIPKVLTRREQERQRETEIYQRNKKAGFVYLMQSGNGYYKIGMSKNTRNRLHGLNRQFPIQIEVVHQIACSDYRKVEKQLHQKYSGKRVENEWFNLDTEDVEWFISLKDHDLDDNEIT